MPRYHQLRRRRIEDETVAVIDLRDRHVRCRVKRDDLTKRERMRLRGETLRCESDLLREGA